MTARSRTDVVPGNAHGILRTLGTVCDKSGRCAPTNHRVRHGDRQRVLFTNPTSFSSSLYWSSVLHQLKEWDSMNSVKGRQQTGTLEASGYGPPFLRGLVLLGIMGAWSVGLFLSLRCSESLPVVQRRRLLSLSCLSSPASFMAPPSQQSSPCLSSPRHTPPVSPPSCCWHPTSSSYSSPPAVPHVLVARSVLVCMPLVVSLSVL